MSIKLLHIAAGIALGFAVSAAAEASPGKLFKCGHAYDDQEICAVSDQTLDKMLEAHKTSIKNSVQVIHLASKPLEAGEIPLSLKISCKSMGSVKICAETEEEVDAAFSCLTVDDCTRD